jgi:hypothetical protein
LCWQQIPAEDMTKTPTGDHFIKASKLKGILPEILEELLGARKKCGHTHHSLSHNQKATEAVTNDIVHAHAHACARTHIHTQTHTHTHTHTLFLQDDNLVKTTDCYNAMTRLTPLPVTYAVSELRYVVDAEPSLT